jgi:Tfp pilus assembly protein PilN
VTSGINMASRPFRNERLPTSLVLIGAVVLAALSVEHAIVLRDLLPGGSSALHQEVAALQQDVSRLRAERRDLRVPAPERATLVQWSLIKGLVDRRTLSWTALLSVLEDVMPPDVRLVSISPETKGDELALDITAIARSQEAALAFVGLLEQRPEFEDIYPGSLTELADGTELRCSMRYRPTGAPPASPGGEESEPDADEPRDMASLVSGRPASHGAGEAP